VIDGETGIDFAISAGKKLISKSGIFVDIITIEIAIGKTENAFKRT
jgi:hypothetical protein